MGTKRRSLILFLTLLLSGVNSALMTMASEICLQNLGTPHSLNASHSPEDQIFAYLAQLVERGKISWDEAPDLLRSIQSGRLVHLAHLGDLEVQCFIDGLSTLLEQQPFDLDRFIRKTSTQIRNGQALHHRREQVTRSTRNSFQSIEWIKVPKGDFSVGHRTVGPYGKEKIFQHRLTRSFEISITVVTIRQWYEVMKLLPAPYLASESEFFSPEGIPKEEAPLWNLPVTYVKWIEAIEFLNRLSIQRNLKPAYKILEDDRSAVRTNIPIQSEDGSIYSTEGYRLPTLVEWEYVRSLGGQIKPWTKPTHDRAEAFLYSNENDDYLSSTEVAELRPFLIQGQPIYDLFGFLSEHLHNSGYKPHFKSEGLTIDHEEYDSDSSMALIADPGLFSSEFRVSTDKSFRQQNSGRNIGFRVVRTLGGKEPKR